MDRKRPSEELSAAAREILGYLNFSTGKPEPRFLEKLSGLFAAVEAGRPAKAGTINPPVWRAVGDVLRAELQAVRGTTDAFREVEQAELRCGWSSTPPCPPTASSIASCCSTRRRKRFSSRFSWAGCVKRCCGRGGRGKRRTAFCPPPCGS